MKIIKVSLYLNKFSFLYFFLIKFIELQKIDKDKINKKVKINKKDKN